MQAAIKKAMTVVQLYLEKFVEFEPLLKVDVPKYKADLLARKLKLKELLDEVKVHKTEQDSLDRRFAIHICFQAQLFHTPCGLRYHLPYGRSILSFLYCRSAKLCIPFADHRSFHRSAGKQCD